MSIKDKSTYGEYYWAMQVEASKAFADEGEKAFAPYIASMLQDIPRIPQMPSGIQSMIDALAEPPDFAFLPYLVGVGVNAVDEVLDIAFDPVLTMLKRAQHRATNTLWSRKKITEGLWDEVIASEGYEAVLGSSLYEAQLPYPSIPDLILYSRYHGDADAPFGEFEKWFNISPRDWPVWKWLGLQRLTTLQVQTLFRRGLIDEYDLYERLARIGWSIQDRDYIQELGWTIPNAMLLLQGNLQQQQSREKILADISIADINPKYAQTYLDAILTKPASQDLVAYNLRKDPSLSELPYDLQKIGIHPDYLDVYQTLAYPIPPVADIITMAVREAFYPDYIEEYGLMQELPGEFLEYTQKQGLSEEWAKRFWASHWELPGSGKTTSLSERFLDR